MNTITVYTDGASRGNPGPGGWAAIIMGGDNVFEIAGNGARVTNNQMELQAAISALTYIQKKNISGTIALHVDSAYVLNGVSKWVEGWVRNNWITSMKKPVENRDLWEQIVDLKKYFGVRIKLVKVAGHSGHVYNDRCDELAVQAALGKKPELFIGTKEEYESMLKKNPPKSEKKPSKSGGTAYSYVSLVDGKVHADKTWAACEKRVKGKKAKYKKVFSKEEETSLIQDYTLETLL